MILKSPMNIKQSNCEEKMTYFTKIVSGMVYQLISEIYVVLKRSEF